MHLTAASVGYSSHDVLPARGAPDGRFKRSNRDHGIHTTILAGAWPPAVAGAFGWPAMVVALDAALRGNVGHRTLRCLRVFHQRSTRAAMSARTASALLATPLPESYGLPSRFAVRCPVSLVG